MSSKSHETVLNAYTFVVNACFIYKSIVTLFLAAGTWIAATVKSFLNFLPAMLRTDAHRKQKLVES